MTSNHEIVSAGVTKLQPALLRPGRLDQLIYIPLPDEASRLQIFKACLKKSHLSNEVNLPALARRTHGFSGADVTEICHRARTYAIRDNIQLNQDLDHREKYSDDIYDDVSEIKAAHIEESMEFALRRYCY